MTIASISRFPAGSFAVTVRDIDENGGIVRVAFKGPQTLQVTAAIPVVTPRRADGTFTSDPVIVAAPLPAADTVEVKAVAAGTDDLTCAMGTIQVAQIAEAAGAAQAKAAHPIPLLLAYDLTGCAARPAAPRDADAHVLADSPFPLSYMIQPGSADVLLRLNDDGDIERAEVVRTDNGSLAKAALDDAVLTTLAPAISACRPVRETFTLSIEFSLKSI